MFLFPAENVFGCHLATLCSQEGTTVPSFVEKCVKAVEKRGNTLCLCHCLNHVEAVCCVEVNSDVLICRFGH